MLAKISHRFILTVCRVFAALPGLKFLDGVARQDEDLEDPPPDQSQSSCVVSWNPVTAPPPPTLPNHPPIQVQQLLWLKSSFPSPSHPPAYLKFSQSHPSAVGYHACSHSLCCVWTSYTHPTPPSPKKEAEKKREKREENKRLINLLTILSL